MRIGDYVQTPQGKGHIVKGSTYALPPARGKHWVFLSYPADPTNRIILFRPSELQLVKG
jgi:hypothetical protein